MTAERLLVDVRATLSKFKLDDKECAESALTERAVQHLITTFGATVPDVSLWHACLHNTKTAFGLLRLELSRFAVLIGLFQENMMSVAQLASSKSGILIPDSANNTKGLRTLVLDKLIALGLAKAPASHQQLPPPDQASSPRQNVPGAAADSDSLKALASLCLADVLQWASDAVPAFNKSFPSPVYSADAGKKLDSLDVSGLRLFPAQGATVSRQDILFFVGANKLDQLRGSVVNIIEEGSNRVCRLELQEVVLSGKNGITLFGSTQLPSPPQDKVKNFRLIPDPARQQAEKQHNVQHVSFNTTIEKISGQVRLTVLSPAAQAASSFQAQTEVDRGRVLSVIGMETEAQSGGGMQACAPMSVVRHMLTAGGAKMADVSPTALVKGATLLRDAAQKFIMQPEAVLMLFHSYIPTLPRGVDGADLSDEMTEDVLYEILHELNEREHLDLLRFHQMAEARGRPYGQASTTTEGSAAERRREVLGHIITNMTDQDKVNTFPCTAVGAADALLHLKQELKSNSATSDCVIQVYSLLMSAANAFRIGILSAGESSFQIFDCVHVGNPHLALLHTTPGHWEAITSVNTERILFADHMHVSLMQQVDQMWRVVPTSSLSPKGKRNRTLNNASLGSPGPLPAAGSASAGTSGRTIDLTGGPNLSAPASPPPAAVDAAIVSIHNLIKSKHRRNRDLARRLHGHVRAATRAPLWISPETVRHAIEHGQCVFGQLCSRKDAGCKRAHPRTSAPTTASAPPPQPQQPAQHSAQPSAPAESLSIATAALSKQMSVTSKQLQDTAKQITKTWASIAAGDRDAAKPQAHTSQAQKRRTQPNRRRAADQRDEPDEADLHIVDVDVEVSPSSLSAHDLLSHLVHSGALSATAIKRFARGN